MRAYFLILAAILLPHLVLSHPGQPSSHMNRVFARRTRSSNKYVPSPRQLRSSRYIQESELQEVQQQQQNIEDVDLEAEVQQQQQQLDTGYGAEKSTVKNGASYNTQAPFSQLSETSTSRPLPIQQQQVQQEKDEDEALPQLNKPLPDEFEDAELSQNYLPQQQQELSYSPVKQMKERNGQRLSQQSYGGSVPQSYGGSAGGSVGGSSGPQTDVFDGFEEEIGSMDMMKAAIRGEPGKDYPVFASVPETGFKCSQQPFPGYYADVEAQCQVFHICQADGRANAFLCPNGTIFSQRHFVCVWWYEFDCDSAPQFYDLNAELYKESESKAAQGGSQNGGLVGGSVPSGKLSSPKENLNKMYMAQIDEFGGVTTSAPSYGYSNGKTNGKSNGRSNGKTSQRSNGGFKATTQPIQYDVSSSVESVTPSILESLNYDTTPYNLDEALGEEIHSETPIIESLSLTTNIPKIQSPVSYGSSGFKGSNGNGNYGNYGSTKGSTLADFGFGPEKLTSPKPSYGGSKGLSKSNGKTSPKMLSQLPEAPVKSGRNGGSKSIYNGNGLKQLKSPASNGFKSYGAPSYGSLKQ